MLSMLFRLRKIRRATARIRSTAHGLAMLAMAGTAATIASAQQYTGPGIPAGVNAATGITGVTTGDPATTVNNIIAAALTYTYILAVGVIVIAGFYLILGLGNDSSKETAKKIIIYTAVGIVILQAAQAIVALFFGLPTGTLDTGLITIIGNVISVALSFAGIVAVAVIVIAGFYLLLGLGSDSSKETARKIIIYAAVGIVILGAAYAIADFFFGLSSGDIGAAEPLRDTVLNILSVFLTFVGLIAVVVIVIAGIYLLVGGGSDQSKETAKKIIIYALVGIVIIVLASAFVNFVIDATTG